MRWSPMLLKTARLVTSAGHCLKRAPNRGDHLGASIATPQDRTSRPGDKGSHRDHTLRRVGHAPGDDSTGERHAGHQSAC
jgi:hypothetical protein